MFVQKLLHKIWLAAVLVGRLWQLSSPRHLILYQSSHQLAGPRFAVCAACNTTRNSVQCNLPETLASTPPSPFTPPPLSRPSLRLMSDVCAQQHGYQVLTSFVSNLQYMTTCQELAAALEAHGGSSQVLAIVRAAFIQVCTVLSLHKVVLDDVNPFAITRFLQQNCTLWGLLIHSKVPIYCSQHCTSAALLTDTAVGRAWHELILCKLPWLLCCST